MGMLRSQSQMEHIFDAGYFFCPFIASWQAIPLGPQYSAAKHGVLGLMRSLYETFEPENIRISVIHPWFAGPYPL